MRVSISISKDEVVAAIQAHILDNVSAGYRRELDDFKIGFFNGDGDLGYFTCIAESEVMREEEEKIS